MNAQSPARLFLAPVAVALLLLTSAPVGQATDELAEAVLQPNLLVVDATEGRVVAYEGSGSPMTDVHVSGVLPAASGFTLVGPEQAVLFGNQSSTAAGVVEFWHQALRPGTYTVLGPDGQAAVVPLTTFDATRYAASDSYLCEGPSQVVQLLCGLLPEVCPDGARSCLTDLVPYDATLPCNDEGRPDCTELVPYDVSLPCNDEGKPDCTELVPYDVILPCNDEGRPDCTELVPYDVSLPCNDESKPSCDDYLCYRIDAESGCNATAPPPPDAEAPACEGAGSKSIKVAEKILWTPVAVIHSPYEGSAEVVSGWGSTRSLFVGGSGYESSLSYVLALETDTGKTSGAFQLVKWGYYKHYVGGGCTGGYEEAGSSAKIIDQEPLGPKETKTHWLHNSKLTTDSDDLTSFSLPSSIDGSVYQSVRVQHQYKQRAGILDTRDGPGLSYGVSSRTFMQLGITMTFSAGGQSYGASIEGKYSASKEQSAYYLYRIPAGNLVYYDDLGGSTKGMLAFCSPQYNACA